MKIRYVSPSAHSPLDSMNIEQRAAFFESILDALPEFIIYYDDELKVMWANAPSAVESKMSKQEMIGKYFFEAACRLKQPCEGCPVIKGLSSETIEIIESKVYEGRLFYARSYPIRARGTRIQDRLFVTQEISHLRNRYSVNEVLNLISEIFHSPKGLPAICQDVINSVAMRFDYPAGFIILKDKESQDTAKIAEVDSSGNFSGFLKNYPPSRWFSWKGMEDGSIVNSTALSKSRDFEGSLLREAGVEAVLAVPFNVAADSAGAILLIDFKERLESSLMVDGLQAAANRLGVEMHRRQMDEKLRKERNFTNAVLSNAGPLIMVLDQNGRIERFNKACERMTGHTDVEMRGKSLLDLLIDSKGSELIRGMFPLAPQKTPPISFESHWMSRDRGKRLISWSNTIMGDGNAPGMHMVSIGIDITEQRKAEEEAAIRRQQLLEADKMVSLGLLASGVAHEINNPNNFIMMNIRILKDAWNDISPILDKYYSECSDFTVSNIPYSEIRNEIPLLFEGIEAGSERIQGIVMNMKNYTKRELPEKFQSVSIHSIINSTVALLTHEIKRSARGLTIDCPEHLPHVKGNPQKLEQVLINLIQNACQALPDRGKAIWITAAHDKERSEIVISVIDEGVGIKPEHLEHICDPFFTTKSDKGGTGLGLSICANIVKEHDGRLEFTSEPGRGTKVCLCLPAMFPLSTQDMKNAKVES